MDVETAEQLGERLGQEVARALEGRTPDEAREAFAALHRYVVQTLPTLYGGEAVSHVERLEKERAAAPLRESREGRDAPAIPDAPIGSWVEDKAAGLTPPQHLVAHYGPWLRHDETGMTFSDVKRLSTGPSETLLKDLRNWLRYRELPADCPLLTVEQRNDIHLDRIATGELSVPTDYVTFNRLQALARIRGFKLPAPVQQR